MILIILTPYVSSLKGGIKLKNKNVILLLLIATLLLSINGMASATEIGAHDISFINHTYDPNTDTSIWYYNVTSGSDPSLSHWSIKWCNEMAIIECSDNDWEYGTDPHTGIKGIKFDTGYYDGETRVVWFELQGDYYEELLYIGTKAGGSKAYGYVKGPYGTEDCPCCPIPELSTLILLSVGLLTLAGYVSTKQEK